jgi:Tol biopolymer transport system component
VRPFVLLAAGLVLVLVLAGQLARAAPPPSEPSFPNDSNPTWARNARFVAFSRERAVSHIESAMVVPAGHGNPWRVVDGHVRSWFPGYENLLVESNGESKIYATDGVEVGSVAGVAAAWSNSASQIAFRRDGVLLAGPDGENARRVADWVSPQSWDLTGPVWSPNEREIAFADGPRLEIAEADGSGVRTVFTGSNQSVNPSWSSDGRHIAFENNDGPRWTIWTVDTKTMETKEFSSGLTNDRFPQYAPVGDRMAFISDRKHVRGEASQYKYSLYVQRAGYSRPQMLLADVHPTSLARWSPTAAQIAVAAGRECLRWGIYIVSPDPVRSRRATNDCHVNGTKRNDILRGRPPFDIINGYGGNDTIYARDGLRDRVDCGPGTDTAYVDAIDFVAHCERVHGK